MCEVQYIAGEGERRKGGKREKERKCRREGERGKEGGEGV
jgi:hypothetical protein